MNIIVEGSRGKSGIVENLTKLFNYSNLKTLGKVSGKTTTIFKENSEHEIERKGNRFFIEKENLKILKTNPDYEHYIFENQALSDYTMKVVHKIVKPEIIIIPNVRYEHQNTLGDTIVEQASSFAINFKGAKMVVTTEPKKEVLDIFKKYCNKYDVKLKILKTKEAFPSEQCYTILTYMASYMKLKYGEKEKLELKNKLKNNLSVKYSESKDVLYFTGSKVNDIESTKNVFEYIKEKNPRKFCFVCYLRLDRNERTKAFKQFFKENIDDPRIDRVYMFGHKINIVKHPEKIKRINESDVEQVYNYCRENDLILFTAINGVIPFMQKLEKGLAE